VDVRILGRNKINFYSLLRSSWAFLTMASLECGSETGSPLYGGSRVPCNMSVHSLMKPVCGVCELKLICKVIESVLAFEEWRLLGCHTVWLL
jgi:hypothetical protein